MSKEYKKEYLPFYEVKKDKTPGFGQDRYTSLNVRMSEVAETGDYNDLINTPTVNNPKIQQFTFNATGNIAVTGVGFTPKLVEFHFTDQSGAYGVGKMTSSYQFAFDVKYSGTQIQTECIYIRNSLGNVIGRAVYVSMDSDGFTINVTFSTGATVYVNYTCF